MLNANNHWHFAERLGIKETEDSYVKRFKRHAPNFPLEIISMWMWRHGPDARLELLHIPPTAFHFRQIEISPNELPDRTAYKNIEFFEMWADETKLNYILQGSKQAILWDYMKKKHTWPVPPLIIDTATSCPNLTYNLKKPSHIVDGHHRIAMSHVLRSKNFLQAHFPLWLCTVYS